MSVFLAPPLGKSHFCYQDDKGLAPQAKVERTVLQEVEIHPQLRETFLPLASEGSKSQKGSSHIPSSELQHPISSATLC